VVVVGGGKDVVVDVVAVAGGAVVVAIVVDGAGWTVLAGSGSAVEYVQLAVTVRRAAIASDRMGRR
jgi:hypothetical protein